MTDEQLAKLIADDDLGLLTMKPKRTPQSTEEERLLDSFREIVRFVEATGAAPAKRAESIDERRLFARLNAIRKDRHHRERLMPFDEHHLLATASEEGHDEEAQPTSIDDILSDGFLDSLDSSGEDILRLKHVPAAKPIEGPDYVAQRTPCKEFPLFEERFQNCHRELRDGRRKLLPFANEQQIETGKFYVLRGVLLLVVEIGERVEKNGHRNARLRCVFENGTESDMLLRSLARNLYKDGRRVTELSEDLLKAMVVGPDDKASGFIYVLRSLSENPQVVAIPNLYKIGLARRSVEMRLQNAENEPTYLMAPVAVVSTFECYNLNLPKLENLLHRFFDHAAAKIQVTDGQGNYHSPKEWFSVPLETIEEVVRLLISGEIVNYTYDASAGTIALAAK